jgi:hypothetical protein
MVASVGEMKGGPELQQILWRTSETSKQRIPVGALEKKTGL